jgi:hypothetical protein
MTPREAVEAAEQAEAETAYRNQLGREMYQAGHADGYRAGYQAACGEREADAAAWWRDHGRGLAERPAHAELEERRWGPGGRAHFAYPRPGDFPGRNARPQPGSETEAEMEATQ